MSTCYLYFVWKAEKRKRGTRERKMMKSRAQQLIQTKQKKKVASLKRDFKMKE